MSDLATTDGAALVTTPAVEPLTARQTLFLLAVAEEPLTALPALCDTLRAREDADAPSLRTVQRWLVTSVLFASTLQGIQGDPATAANFALRHAQAAAVGALVKGIRGKGSRTQTEAASLALREIRARSLGQAALEALDALLAGDAPSRAAPEATSPPTTTVETVEGDSRPLD